MTKIDDSPAKGEKMTETKSLHILNHLIPPQVYFGFHNKGIGKLKTSELVSFGCRRTIVRLGNEFVDTQVQTYTTAIGSVVDGHVQRQWVQKFIPKE